MENGKYGGWWTYALDRLTKLEGSANYEKLEILQIQCQRIEFICYKYS